MYLLEFWCSCFPFVAFPFPSKQLSSMKPEAHCLNWKTRSTRFWQTHGPPWHLYLGDQTCGDYWNWPMSILPYFTSLITNAPPRTYKAGLPFWLLFNSCSVVFRFKAPCSYDPLTVVYLYCHYDWVLFSWQFSVTCKANFFSYFNQNYVDSW